MLPVRPLIFQRAGRAVYSFLRVIGQRQHGLGKCGIVVAVLDPAVALDDEIAHPARRRRRLLGEAQRHLVAGVHDDVAVVDGFEQFAHVAVARVVADQVAPVLLGALDPVVVGHFRSARAHGHVHDGISAIVQVGHRRIESHLFQWRIGHTLRPLDRVPINFQVRAQAHAARRSGTKDVGQIEQNRFLAARGKTEIVLRRDPAAVAVGHFEAQPMCAPAIALRDGDVDRRFGVVDRALRDQIERAAGRRIVAQIDFQIVVAGYALVLAAAEAVDGFSVERA